MSQIAARKAGTSKTVTKAPSAVEVLSAMKRTAMKMVNAAAGETATHLMPFQKGIRELVCER